MGIILQNIHMAENGSPHFNRFYDTLGIIAGAVQGICIISGVPLPIFSKKILIWEFMIQINVREFILKGFPRFGCQNSNLKKKYPLDSGITIRIQGMFYHSLQHRNGWHAIGHCMLKQLARL